MGLSSTSAVAAIGIIIRSARPTLRATRRVRRAAMRVVRRAVLATTRPTRRSLRATLRPVRRVPRATRRKTRLALRIVLLACLLSLGIFTSLPLLVSYISIDILRR